MGLILSAILIFMIYSNILDSPFIFDDNANIKENTHIRINEFTLSNMLDAGYKSICFRRPVANISFALNYSIGGKEVAEDIQTVQFQIPDAGKILFCGLRILSSRLALPLSPTV